MTATDDLLSHNRQRVAAAYRRLADAALIAAQVYTDPDAVPGELHAKQTAQGRQESITHALAVLDASRRGIAKGRAVA